MNILQVLPELKSGGVERGTIDLAKHLVAKGHKAVIVSAGGPLAADLAAAGIKHYTLPVHKKSPFSIYRSVKTLSKIVELEKIDIVHARSRVPAIVAFFSSRRTHVPFITTCHGFYSKHALSRFMGWGKLVIVASHIIGKRMRDDFSVPHRKIRLIHRGVNLNEFTYSPGLKKEIIVGVIGRLTPIKGHPLFLKAMARVTRVHPNIKIQIIGDAPKPQYKEELQTLAKQLGITKSVEFLGTRYDIPALLSKMSVLVVPSIGEEAFGRVAIEAGACGIPVVATRMGGLIDIMEDEKDGLLVSPDDPRLLAEAVMKLVSDPQLAARYSRSLRMKVEKEFSLDLMFEKTLAVYNEAIAQKRVLIIKMSAVGDVILSIPSIRAVREKYPQAWIAVLVGRKSRKIIRNCPIVDDTIVYDEPSKKERAFSILRMASILAKEDFDAVIDLQNNKTSHLLAFLCGARLRAGHQNRKWSFLLNRAHRGSESAMPPLEHQFKVLKMIDIEAFDRKLQLWSGPAEEKAVDILFASQWVSKSQTLVGINPGSSLRWPTKQWPVENFAKLCDELAKRNIRVVITGAPEDVPLADELFKMTRNKPINAVGKTTITELVSLVKRCQVFISSDSAPMHIASSVNIPLVAIFGPTDPKRHLVAPVNYQVFWKEVQCSPCYLRSCPMGLICMKRITVQEVLDSVLHFLKERRPASVGGERLLATP